MRETLVTIARFSHPHESHVWRARLESEGIGCFLADEHTVSANWFYSNAVGGVKLQVRASDSVEARRLLEGSEARQLESLQDHWRELDERHDVERFNDDADATSCPRCESTEVFYQKFSRPMVFLSILLLGIPLPFLSRRWTCRNCELTWKMKLFQ